MKNTFILFIILTSSAFAGSPEKPCLVPGSGKSSDAVVTRQSINDILNKTVRSNQDFIGPVKRVTIPGIPPSPSYKTQYNLFDPTPDHALRDLVLVLVLVLDAGTQVGRNRNSEDFGLFTGFTKRY